MGKVVGVVLVVRVVVMFIAVELDAVFVPVGAAAEVESGASVRQRGVHAPLYDLLAE